MVAVKRYAKALAEGISEALPSWVERCVSDVMIAWRGEIPHEVAVAAGEAGRRAGSEVGSAVSDLLEADIDDQCSTPLALVRSAVRYPTEVLEAAGVPPVERDDFSAGAFPSDVYDLSPASWADIDPALVQPALQWGAAKAFEHKRRHQGGQG